MIREPIEYLNEYRHQEGGFLSEDKIVGFLSGFQLGLNVAQEIQRNHLEEMLEEVKQ